MGFWYRYLFHIMINQEFLYRQHWIWEIPKSLYLNDYDQKICITHLKTYIGLFLFSREWEEDGEDDVILDIETSENVQSTNGKAIKASDAKKKGGRPAKPRNEATCSWTDDEINILIEAWTEHENLCNIKHKSYFNTDIQQKSLISMESMLNDNNNCYCKTNWKENHQSEKLLRRWKTYDWELEIQWSWSWWSLCKTLEVLQKFRIFKRCFHSTESTVMQMMRMMAHPMSKQNFLLLKHPRNLLWQNNELHRAMSIATTTFKLVISSKKNQKPQGEDVGDTFGKILVGQLKLIPECNWKISLQQMVLRCKRQVNSSNNTWQGQLASIVQMPAPLQQSPFATQQNSMPSFASPWSPLSSLNSQQSYSSSSIWLIWILKNDSVL